MKCKCGCGADVRSGNKYIVGHNWKGKKRPPFSLVHRRRIANAGVGNENAKGGEWTYEARLARSELRGGSGSWISTHPYMSEKQFGSIKQKVLKRDGNRCVSCSRKVKKKIGKNGEQTVEVHHVVPVKIGYKSKFCDSESNLITLCPKCHHHFEPNGRNGKIESRWRQILPLAKQYLSMFGYGNLLLDKYIRKM